MATVTRRYSRRCSGGIFARKFPLFETAYRKGRIRPATPACAFADILLLFSLGSASGRLDVRGPPRGYATTGRGSGFSGIARDGREACESRADIGRATKYLSHSPCLLPFILARPWMRAYRPSRPAAARDRLFPDAGK